MFYWLLKYIFMGPILQLMGRPKVEGLENIPSSGPAILAGNHLAVVDSFFLPLVCPRRVTFLAKSEYFTEPGFKGWLKKVFFGGSGQVPIDRTSADAAENALSTAKRLLGEEAVGHLPGGHALARRSSVQGQDRAGAYGAGNRGAGHSVAMVGTNVMNPPGTARWHFSKVTVKIGKPLDFSRFDGMAGNRFIERAVIDEVMYELMQLSGQEYVDIYAASLKKDADTPKPAGPAQQPDRMPESAAG